MKLCQLAEPIRIARDNLRRTQFHMRSEEASATSMITPIVVSRILFGSQIHQIIPCSADYIRCSIKKIRCSVA